ncbi:hypothetical protein [Rhizobium sp. GN54]|uniref:hypothetical protein n=1 Tax=Rhizobium sp. GN54 TaxID=2898150 RepID=UPI001E3670F0|nr:hypothetical protein [Rhizobium sp. GN54]MCD2185411.1 hypothetical protein [Rhizobium sp. GN54]
MKALLASLSAFLVAGMVATTDVHAQDVTLAAPFLGATSHANDVALSVYYLPADAGALEVVVTYVGDAEANQPRRTVMRLADGDRVRFGLPGHPGTLYEFTRNGATVKLSAETVGPRAPKSSDS